MAINQTTQNGESNMKNEITSETIDNVTYYSITVRGLEFLIYKLDEEWLVGSSRTSLGGLKRNPGTWRYFDAVEEIGKSIKSLKNIHMMIN